MDGQLRQPGLVGSQHYSGQRAAGKYAAPFIDSGKYPDGSGWSLLSFSTNNSLNSAAGFFLVVDLNV